VLAGVFGGALVGGDSRVISTQPHLMCVQRDKRMPAMIPTMADAHAPMMSVRSVALYIMDGGGVAIFVFNAYIVKGVVVAARDSVEIATYG